MTLIERLRKGQTFHCPDCGFGFPVQDPTAADELEAKDARIERLEDAAEMLWVVLANVSGGDWEKQTAEWQEAAARWRDNYFEALTEDKP